MSNPTPRTCPNPWHASAPSRMGMRCPECPPPSAPDPKALSMIVISAGVAEIYAGDHQVGLITWDSKRMTTRWYATYANGDATVTCDDREAALECIRLQHAVVQRLARSIRSIRPASEAATQDPRGVSWDFGYNTSLRDVEKVLREAVGQAPEGEGYTAITGPRA